MSKCPKHITGMTSSYAHCRRWQEQPHQILFSQSLHHLVHIWARLYEGRVQGARLSLRGMGGGRPPIMLPPVCFPSMLMLILVLVAAKKLSNAAVSLHLAVLFILFISEGSFWMEVVKFGKFSSVVLITFVWRSFNLVLCVCF